MRAAETALPARMWSRWSHKNQLNLLQLRLHPLLQEPPFSTGVGALTNGLLLYVQSLGQQLFSRFACTTGSTLNIHLGRRIRVCISITLATEKRSIDALEPPKHCFFPPITVQILERWNLFSFHPLRNYLAIYLPRVCDIQDHFRSAEAASNHCRF